MAAAAAAAVVTATATARLHLEWGRCFSPNKRAPQSLSQTLGNGERWEGKLIRGSHCNGPWTCTNKSGTIEEVIQFSEKED